jgi:hypothetical protein
MVNGGLPGLKQEFFQRRFSVAGRLLVLTCAVEVGASRLGGIEIGDELAFAGC